MRAKSQVTGFGPAKDSPPWVYLVLRDLGASTCLWQGGCRASRAFVAGPKFGQPEIKAKESAQSTDFGLAGPVAAGRSIAAHPADRLGAP